MLLDPSSDYEVNTFPDLAPGTAALQNELHETLLRLVPDWVERLGPNLNQALSEPLLYPYLNEEEAPGIESILIGHVPPPRRPAETLVQTQGKGGVFIPGTGWLWTDRPNEALQLRWDGLAFTLHAGPDVVPMRVERPLIIPSTSVELLTHRHPATDAFVAQQLDPNEVSYLPDQQLGAQQAAKAISLLRAISPRHAEELTCKLVRCALLQGSVLSFATLGLSGMALLKVVRPSVSYFLEDLVHQAGHVALFNFTWAEGTAYTIPSSTPMGLLTGNERDTRTLDSAFHGNFTLSRMGQAFDRVLQRRLLTGEEAWILRGRMKLTLIRLRLGLEDLDEPRLFQPAALDLHQACAKVLDQLWSTWWTELQEVTVNDRIYVFDEEDFLRSNPIPSSTASALSC